MVSNNNNEESLYETTAVNVDGVGGTAYVDRKDGMRVVVSNPLSDAPGSNPEELLGLSLSTCFNSTLHSILKEQGKTNRSKVSVPVQMKEEPSEKGYYFKVEIQAAIEGASQAEAERITEAAEKRCPVSKLLQGSSTVHVKIIPYQNK